MKDYLDITVRISPGTTEGAYTVNVESSQGGSVTTELRLPFTLPALSGTVFGVAQTARGLGTLKPDDEYVTDTRSARDFGVELFEALFQGEGRDVFTATLSQAQSRLDTGVRIRLSMNLQSPGMAEVACLPWELMCRKGQRPLALSNQTPLVRTLDAPQPAEPRPFRAPLRILAIMSQPSGTGALNLEEERALIEKNWAQLPGVQVDFVRPVRADIARQLANGDYHVVHYMGHGDFKEDCGGKLLLEMEDRSPDEISGDDFATLLADEPLRLVFLNACKTATTSMRTGLHPFAGIATTLIQEQIPAVVAMQFPISDQGAIAFAQTFYERIAHGFPVDAAVSEGRKVLNWSKQSEWATPVLYLRSKDGALFVPTIDEPALASAKPAGQPTSAGAASALATPDVWGPGAADALRVFLATPDQNLERMHAQLSKALKADGVRVVDSVPRDDLQEHAAAVDRLVRDADLSVHLLGANPGQRLDDDDTPDTLGTFQLEQLRIGLDAARSQLVVMTREDRESIGNEKYAAKVEELAKLPRDKARFELVITDKNHIAETVKAKLQQLRDARQATSAAGSAMVRRAFVDSHVSDQDCAFDLVSYLEKNNVETGMRTSSGSSASDYAHLDKTVRESPLYIIVAGRVDRDWLINRRQAVQKSAVQSRSALLIAKYAATPVEGAQDADVTLSRLEITDALNDSDPGWIDKLFAPADQGQS